MDKITSDFILLVLDMHRDFLSTPLSTLLSPKCTSYSGGVFFIKVETFNVASCVLYILWNKHFNLNLY